MRRSGDHLAEHLQDVPVMILPCIEGRVEHGSRLRAGDALRVDPSRGLVPDARAAGTRARRRLDHRSAHLRSRRAGRSLGMPAEITQAALLAVAFFTGTGFGPAARRPAARRHPLGYVGTAGMIERAAQATCEHDAEGRDSRGAGDPAAGQREPHRGRPFFSILPGRSGAGRSCARPGRGGRAAGARSGCAGGCSHWRRARGAWAAPGYR